MVCLRIAFLAALVVTCHCMKFEINSTFNGATIEHAPIKLRLEQEPDTAGDLRLTVESAPFFNNEPPPALPGEPFMTLWDYEVVEAFFLNSEEKYLEVELAPGGQHIDLLLHHPRNTIRHSLPMRTSTEVGRDTWTGYCTIPAQYLPFNVTLFNAYAIHNDDEGNRHYEALYPANQSAQTPDFHNLAYFQHIDLSKVLTPYPTKEESQFWKDALQGIFRYRITTQWNGASIDHPNPVEVTLQSAEAGVKMTVKAFFYNDDAPTDPAGSLMGLWNYEVVEMMFLNDNEEYLQIDFGPHGHFIILLLQGSSKSIKDSLNITYNTNIASDNIWTGEAIIPAAYFPPNVTKINAFAMHNSQNDRVYEALYPAPENNPGYSNADFHKLELFQKVDFEFQLADNSQYSDVWLDAMNPDSTDKSTDTVTTEPPPTTLGTERTQMDIMEVNYQITTDWTGTPTSEPQVDITMQPFEDHDILLTLRAVFYNESASEGSYDNTTYYKLGEDEEVVEVMFLNAENHYFQIQLTPLGYYQASLYNGAKHAIRTFLPLTVETDVLEDRWTADVLVPRDYLPSNTNRFNAHSKHGSGDNKQVYSLYPAGHRDDAIGSSGLTAPDVHDLQYFNTFNVEDLIPDYKDLQMSQLWEDSIQGIFRYKILKDSNGNNVDHDPVEVTLQGFQAGIEVNITSPLFSEKIPDIASNTHRWCEASNQYEAVKFIFQNDAGEGIVIELGPWEHYFIYYINSEGNIINGGDKLDYFVAVRQPRSIDYPNGIWSGSALIPIAYLPSDISKFNVMTSYGSANARTHESLHLPSSGTLDIENEVAFTTSLAKGIDFEFLESDDRKESSYWNNILRNTADIMNLTNDKSELCNRLVHEQVYTINKTWDGADIKEDHVTVKLQPHNGNVVMSVQAPYYADPPPNGKPGKALMGLWNYEVVEAFFLNNENQYVEVEIAPGGQHLVLLLSKRRHPVRYSLPLQVITNIEDKKWMGVAIIPADYFPPEITRFNAYSIHGVEPNRNYYSLYPADSHATVPDFHGLKYFKPIDFSQMLPAEKSQTMSRLWTNSINGIIEYTVNQDLYGAPTPKEKQINIIMKGFQAGVEMNFTAPYYNDVELPELSLMFDDNGLYEEVELLFINKQNNYLSVRLGPHGHQKVSLYYGANKRVKTLEVDYIVEALVKGDDGRPGIWRGSVLIPPEYFPANVSRFNILNKHEGENSREYSSLYANPNDELTPSGQHNLDTSDALDFEFLVVNNKETSTVWQEVINSIRTSNIRRQPVGNRRRSQSLRRKNTTQQNARRRPPPKTNLLKPLLTQQQKFKLTPQNDVVDQRLSFEDESNTFNAIDDPLQHHPICYKAGLVQDRIRCQLFYECVIENGQWQVYNWRCSRGLVFDSQKVACVRGFC